MFPPKKFLAVAEGQILSRSLPSGPEAFDNSLLWTPRFSVGCTPYFKRKCVHFHWRKQRTSSHKVTENS